jgi:hypothetical protein
VSILNRCESRNGAVVRLLAVHSSEGDGTAAALRDASWWEGSSHAIADERTLLTPAQGCVPYAMAAWTIRNANPISDNIELVGWAKWTRPDWLARPGLLENCAAWLAERSRARGIPLVKLSTADVLAGKSGVIGHVDWTRTGDGTHTDPGTGFPFDLVLARARALLAPPVAAAPRPVQEDDFMYVATQFDVKDGPVTYAVYSGGVLTGLDPSSGTSAAANIKAGALCQWVSKNDWAELDRKSKLLTT